jgi:transposase
MNLKQFYEHMLRLKDPWYVDSVEIDDQGNRVDVYVKHHNPIRVACPVCNEFFSMYDHAPERIFEHLNTCQMRTFVHIRLPRVNCSTHGIKQIVSELGEPNSHMTFAFECRLLDLAKECSIAAVSRLSALSWDESHGCVARAVERGLARKIHRIPERIGVDEKSFAKGHKFETLVVDHERATIEFVVDDNSQKSLEAYYELFTPAEKESVKVVTMDMWDPFIAATRKHIPNASKKIVFDRFHVMGYATNAVDKVRKEENARLKESGNDMLVGTKYLWLWNPENMPKWRIPEFNDLQQYDLDVARAWAIKENLKHLWDYHSETWARKFFKKWYFWATHSRLEPVIRAANTIKNHFENIVTYVHHHLTNAVVEGLNNKIEKVKRMAYGYRNRAHYRLMIYFHCGGLDLSLNPPTSSQIRWAPLGYSL